MPLRFAEKRYAMEIIIASPKTPLRYSMRQ
jgi:hypothetical protein